MSNLNLNRHHSLFNAYLLGALNERDELSGGSALVEKFIRCQEILTATTVKHRWNGSTITLRIEGKVNDRNPENSYKIVRSPIQKNKMCLIRISLKIHYPLKGSVMIGRPPHKKHETLNARLKEYGASRVTWKAINAR